MARKVMVVGLDCAPPRLLYQELINELEVLGPLIKDGARYTLISSHPPITIPAWAVMVTGKTPGELGLYGFRHRRPGDFKESYIANSRLIKERCIWDELGMRRLRSIVVGVPPSYPPRPIRGYMVGCFITPGPETEYTWPPSLKKEIESLVGPYIFDVVYRSHEKDKIVKELWEMTKQHFKVLKYLAQKKWDFFMFVEIGVDRVHHAFWKYFDPQHHRYEAGNKYEDVIPNYYKLIDHELGELLKLVPKDTVIVLASDHGVKAMKGAFCINQWLVEQGYLKLKDIPRKPGVDLDDLEIDWSKTIAWGWGGYYARIFINLKGREPQGIVDPKDYESIVEQLKRDIQRVRGPNGEVWNTKVYTPNELYPVVRGDAPDLIVYLDDLSWRAAGTLGWESNYLPENDRGPDDAVHDWYGIFTIYDPEQTIKRGFIGNIDIKDIYSEVLMRIYT